MWSGTYTAEMKDVAQGIVQHVDELAPDLIVMCTHGSGGLRDVLFGSIAQQVVARGTTPVVLIRPTEEGVAESFTRQRLLVPLDGSPEHEGSLPAAVELGYACPAELHLVFVVPTLSTLRRAAGCDRAAVARSYCSPARHGSAGAAGELLARASRRVTQPGPRRDSRA